MKNSKNISIKKGRHCRYRHIKNRPLPHKAKSDRYISDSCRRLSYYCDGWLHFKKIHIRESTYIKYKNILKNHIKPELGDYLLSAINSKTVEDFTNGLLLKKALSKKTVKDILVVLNSILVYTSSLTHGAPNVKINYPKPEHREMRVLSHSEQENLVKYLCNETDFCKLGVLLMLILGIRIGELCALKWENVDFKEKTVRISATLQRLRDETNKSGSLTQIVISTPKSETSVRTIPMTDCAFKLISKFRVNNPNAYILTGTEKFMEPRMLQYKIKKYTAGCGLDGVHAHTLRHTFATRAVEVGFEIKSLSEILGHANTTITLQRYIHTSMELKRTNMNKLYAAGM